MNNTQSTSIDNANAGIQSVLSSISPVNQDIYIMKFLAIQPLVNFNLNTHITQDSYLKILNDSL